MIIHITEINLVADIRPRRLEHGTEVQCDLIIGDETFPITMDAASGIVYPYSKGNVLRVQQAVAAHKAMVFIQHFTDEPICADCGIISHNNHYSTNWGVHLCHSCGADRHADESWDTLQTRVGRY